MSALLWGILVVGAAVSLAIGGMLLVRRSVTLAGLERHNQVAGFIYAVIGVVYAVLLAFVAIVVWQQHTRARTGVEQEANQLGDLYRDARAFPEGVRVRLQHQIRTYVRVVVEKEWPAMANGEASPEAWEAYNKLWLAYQQFQPRNAYENAWYTESLNRLNQLGDHRRLRLLANRSAVPGIMWVVLLGTGVITIGFSAFFGTETLWAYALMVAALAATITLVLFLILALDQPFSGVAAVEPEAFLQVENIFDHWTRSTGSSGS
jgi:hypothetical protein